MLRGGAGVHEGLGDDGERGVHGGRLVDVEEEVGVLDEVDPEPQREAKEEGNNMVVLE